MHGLNSWRLQVRGFVYNVLLFCTSNQAQLSSNVHGVSRKDFSKWSAKLFDGLLRISTRKTKGVSETKT